MSVNVTNPVEVGLATKVDHYDRIFNNFLAIYAGEMAITGQAAGDDLYATSASQLGVGRRQLRQSFRGLRLRTHPDADAAAKKVFLDRADEIVMHDGTSVLDWDDLSADITAAGANGLDTGAEGASRWYEIYAIRKSSDGTKGLLLHRARSHDADQLFSTAADASRSLRLSTGTATDKIAQGVQFTAAGAVPFIDVLLNRTGTPSGNVWFTLESDSAGSPSGTVLATSDKLAVDVWPTADTWLRFQFRAPYTVVAGTQYHLVLQGDYTRSDANHVIWRGVAAGGYANGVSKDYNGTSWSATSGANGLDRNFKLYVTANDTAVTMPSGYDQRCLIGRVRNNGSSDFVPFQQADRQVQYGTASPGSLGTFTNTDIMPVDVAAFVPENAMISSVLLNGSGLTDFLYIDSYSTPNQGNTFISSTGASGYSRLSAEIPVEAGLVYIKVGAGTNIVHIVGYRW